MHLGDVIKKYRFEHGKMSMQAFADKCGLSKGYIAMLERNKNSKTGEPVVPSIETFIKVASAMNITLDNLISVIDENQPVTLTQDNVCKPSGVSIPIVGSIVAGLPADAYDDILGYEEISHDLARTGEFICLRIKGESMLPVLQEGDLVVIRLQADIDSGEIAAIRINGNEATIKKVDKSKSGIILIAYNPIVYPPKFYTNREIEELPVEVIGKVVEMHRSF